MLIHHSVVHQILRLALLSAIFCGSQKSFATILTDAQKPSAQAFEAMRYGNFTHMVYRLTISPDGKKSYQTPDEFVEGFDANAYAEQIHAMGMEYVIFTAWHAAMYHLGPNQALDKWLPGHTTKRDLIGEVADALQQRGIKMIIYAHPNDGHDLTPEEQAKCGFVKPADGENALMPVFNDFINEVYAETAKRYANKPNVIGYWWDSWGANGGAVDMPRLRRTLLAAMPRAIILSNYYHGDFIDFTSLEKYYPLDGQDRIDNVIVQKDNQSTVFAGGWWCGGLGESSVYSPENLFKFTVLNACSGAPGGMAWAVSPTSNGSTWAGNCLEVMQKLGSYIRAIRPSICGVAPSVNWPIDENTTVSSSKGYGATRSLDGRKEYIHVIKKPEGQSLDLEPTVDVFDSARLLSNGHLVKMESTPKSFRLTLGNGDHWDSLHTVIVLERDMNAKTPVLRQKSVSHDDKAIRYTGAWESRASHQHTQSSGACAEISFVGTRFAWYGVTGQDHGIARVIIDDGPPVIVDCYSVNRNDRALCYSVRLPYGKHTVRIENSGEKNLAGKGRFIEIGNLVTLEGLAPP